MTDFNGIRHSDALAFATGGDMRAGQVAGLAIRFDSLNRNGWQVAAGALSWEATIPMLWAHADGEVIGSWQASAQADGVHVTGRINLATRRGEEARALIMAGDLDGLSVESSCRRRVGSPSQVAR